MINGESEMSQSLSPENQAYIDSQVAGGAFASRDEAIDAGVALLRKRDELVGRLKESRRQLDEGELTQYDDESLAARFDELKAKAAARSQS
jgi:Arc/MetJ-type ribon-helix-helix transcriptional regulator